MSGLVGTGVDMMRLVRISGLSGLRLSKACGDTNSNAVLVCSGWSKMGNTSRSRYIASSSRGTACRLGILGSKAKVKMAKSRSL
jgi:hypothetical protein